MSTVREVLLSGSGTSGSTPSSSLVSKVGGVVRSVLTSLTDGTLTELLFDTLGRLRTRDAAFDDLNQALKVSVDNLVSVGPWFTVGSSTNLSAATHYFPVDSGNGGIAVERDDWVALEIIATDVDNIGIEAWIGDGDDYANALDITLGFIDRETGVELVALMDTGAAASDTWIVILKAPAGITHYRVKYTPYDATSTIEVRGLHGKM